MGLFVYSFIVRLLFIQQPGNTHGIYRRGVGGFRYEPSAPLTPAVPRLMMNLC